MKVIDVNNLSKIYYQVLAESSYLSLRDKFSKMVLSPKDFLSEKRKKNFIALNNINFHVNAGEVLGVIGPNGAGKSTLLKILSRITMPTSGNISIKGRISSMLEVGTGFHPELTGRENIFINAILLGMTKKDVYKKLDEIVDFSGIEKFLDTPIKYYSSGMSVRLAFSIAAHLDSDVLLIDEVLAVGDVDFQKKSLNKIDKITKGNGKTVIFVSHDMSSIKKLCNKSLLLSNGEVSYIGDTNETVERYLKNNKSISKIGLLERSDRKGKNNIFFAGIKLNKGNQVVTGEELEIEINYNSNLKNTLNNYRVGIKFNNQNGDYLFACLTEVHSEIKGKSIEPKGKLVCKIERLPLPEGEYVIDLFFEVNKEVEDWVKYAIVFDVKSGNFYSGECQFPSGYKNKGVLVDHKWEI
ncbi:MAG: ABC transporter ATP-binding protein [Patescibacteria group bacterium]|jgi:lipopolysaccharide transport system ATP-binding protein|nr:ABC transporter ATP-binding protein [Patescibacteria group bacterium]